MKTHVLILFTALAGGRAASAQAVSVGVKGGFPLLDGTTNRDESRFYIVGPSLEVRLPAGFAIEADALYRRIGNSFGFISSIGTVAILAPGTPFTFTSRLRGNSWEFPLLGKYYFHQQVKGGRVFAGTGYAFRTVRFNSSVTQTGPDASGSPFTRTFKNDFSSDLQVGGVVAAGLRFHAGHFAFAPEARYTRWGGSNGSTLKNEASLLLGISF